MDILVIQSSESDSKLTLTKPQPKNIKHAVESFNAKLESHKIPTVECFVFDASGKYFYDYIKSIEINATDSDALNYYSLEDNLIIDAIYKNETISLKVKLRSGPWDDDWQVEELITLDKNNYNNLLVQLANFLRLK